VPKRKVRELEYFLQQEGMLKKWWRHHFNKTCHKKTTTTLGEWSAIYPQILRDWQKEESRRCGALRFSINYEQQQIMQQKCLVRLFVCDETTKCCTGHPRISDRWRSGCEEWKRPWKLFKYHAWWQPHRKNAEELKDQDSHERLYFCIKHHNYITESVYKDGLHEANVYLTLNQSGILKFILPAQVAVDFFNYC
jgi:hypothetical protein